MLSDGNKGEVGISSVSDKYRASEQSPRAKSSRKTKTNIFSIFCLARHLLHLKISFGKKKAALKWWTAAKYLLNFPPDLWIFTGKKLPSTGMK